MKKASVLRFTRKCLKAGYKTQVCRDAWIFGKTPDTDLKQMFKDSFAKEKVFVSPHSLGRRSKTLKMKTAPKKITKKMMLSALGPRFASSI